MASSGGHSSANTRVQMVPVVVPTDRASWDVGTPATCPADVAPTFPLTITTGVNDTFFYTPGSRGSPITYTLAPGVLATLASCVAAMGAATGTGLYSGPFSDFVDVTIRAGALLLTEKTFQDGSALGVGNGGGSDLGFTGNSDFFAGHTGSVGRWDFSVPGQISQTDAAIDSAFINSLDSIYGVSWAVEAHVAGTPVTAGFQAGDTGIGDGSGFVWAASGPAASVFIGGQVTNDAGTPLDLPATIRAVVIGSFAALFSPADTIIQHALLYGGQSGTDPDQSVFRLAGSGLITFSGLKAWNTPLPVLP